MSDVRRQKKVKIEGQAVLRGRRQLTLPRAICEALGLKEGADLSFEVQDGKLVGTPGRMKALDALAEVRKAFAASGVTLEELLAAAPQVRAEVAHEMYPDLFPDPGVGRRKRRSA
jgi:antitoxin component of MazEF toxin-antitoxin module